ncbi:Crp/Fnr family transcriptional regulator [Pseudoalteromonas aurantia]|uniref:Cyclic nucleotide-binding domain-containing protein n=1 Tax=Pseudoalteromonas aurantia 208 TaxID=1314867 RepID=A0ABR9EAV9_9GAMM|nr:Crp/Fnr family transcriptional regulator [Pseudoalteromonas aurantia]MBE0368127.1 hypothetical protein [Pseudoalteromonas aurantia 208]
MNFDEFIKRTGIPVSFEKGAHVFHQGDSNDSLYFVISGLAKAYYLSIDGKESIKSFIKPGNMISSLSSAHARLPCTFNLLVLENTQLLEIPFKCLTKAAKEHHAIANQLIDRLLMLSMKKEQREYELLTLSVESRYLNFMEREPILAEQLTQNDIAKYLGVTPVALSRIKNRLK